MSSIPSGPVTPSLMTTSSVVPATASTTRPSQSVLIPYSNRVPGSATSGARKAAMSPGTTLGRPVTCSYFTMSAFQNQYDSPDVWVSRCRTVARERGARSRGVSPSKPSRTWRSSKSFTYSATGAARSSSPRSTCCSAAVVATILVIDMIRNCVVVDTGTGPPSPRCTPAAPS